MRIGILGCGRQAPKHIKGFRAAGVSDLVVADAEPERAKRLAEKEDLKWFPEPAALFADDTVAGVVLCTPTPSHVPLIHAALETGKHFLCEKPLCQSLEEARGIEAALSRRKLTGMVGYIYRAVPVFHAARRILRPPDSSESPLGALTLVWSRIGGRGSNAAWKHRRDQGGGAVNEMLVHTVDLLLWLLGGLDAPVLVDQALLHAERGIDGTPVRADAEDFVVARFTGPEALRVYCEADLITPEFRQCMEIQGTNGSLVVSIQADGVNSLYLKQAVGGYPAGAHELKVREEDPYCIQARTFLDAISGAGDGDYATVAQAQRVLELIAALRMQADRRDS
ncbi:MAG: Gfo/Idh/MocA family protein [Gammaproteobacteria bacterium]